MKKLSDKELRKILKELNMAINELENEVCSIEGDISDLEERKHRIEMELQYRKNTK